MNVSRIRVAALTLAAISGLSGTEAAGTTLKSGSLAMGIQSTGNLYSFSYDTVGDVIIGQNGIDDWGAAAHNISPTSARFGASVGGALDSGNFPIGNTGIVIDSIARSGWNPVTDIATGFKIISHIGAFPDMKITQSYSKIQTSSGAVFDDKITLANIGTETFIGDFGRSTRWEYPSISNAQDGYETISGVPGNVWWTHNGKGDANPLAADFGAIGCSLHAGTNIDRYGCGLSLQLFLISGPYLGPGESEIGHIFYGAGQDRAEALSLINSLGVDVYGLLQADIHPNDFFGPHGADDYAPTFFIAASSWRAATVPEPSTLLMFVFVAGLTAFGTTRRSRASAKAQWLSCP